MKTNIPFHFAFPVNNIKETIDFYVGVLGCKIGRSALHWVDFDFYGHQLTAHENSQFVMKMEHKWRKDSKYPIIHFGAILEWSQWHELKATFIESNISFVVEPHVAFLGEVGEQMSMFLEDPSGYAIEFKTFEFPDRIFLSK
ncbi:glyoxalase [bacterium SCSIO 12643]|nr:glyoxalase [bacterium SCSIO 12643]